MAADRTILSNSGLKKLLFLREEGDGVNIVSLLAAVDLLAGVAGSRRAPDLSDPRGVPTFVH
jgi:hypothetical protein